MSSPDPPQLIAQCLCAAHTFTAPLPTVPLLTSPCHCTSCRRVTGGLYTTCVRWPLPQTLVDASRLARYAFTPRSALLFCSTCSTPLFWETEDGLKVLTGVLARDEKLVVEYIEQCFVPDTQDGGASVWLSGVRGDGTALPCYTRQNDSEALDIDWATSNNHSNLRENAIPIRCRCRGVDFSLHRADYTGTDAAELPWYIDPTSRKLLADFCGCDSCRLQSGVDTWYWAFTHIAHVTFGSTISSLASSAELKAVIDARHSDVGTLAYFASSPGVLRFFCACCSACVFYAVEDRPEVLDVAVGLLGAAEGARAETWLSWRYGGRISWRDDAEGTWMEGLFDKIEKGAEEWRIRKGEERNWRRVMNEGPNEKRSKFL